MRVWKKIFTIFLAISLAGTAMPQTAFAVSSVKEAEEKETKAPEAGELSAEKQDIISPQEGREKQKQEAVSGKGAIMPREVVESYTMITEGQELQQTTGDTESYLFAPEESGYYRLACESVNGQEFYFETVKCIYYTEGEDGVPVQKDYNTHYSVMERKMERIVWLNQEEQYVFNCRAYSNYDTDKYDFKLRMDKVEIKDITVAQNPTIDSYDFLNYQGMQVSINFVDGTSTLSEVESNKYNSYCYIKAFTWPYLAYDRQYQMGHYAQLQSVDGKENVNADIKSLETGSHTAVLRILEYNKQGETSTPYDFQMQFTVQRGNVKSLQVQNPKTEYTQDFNEELGAFELLASYNDGTEDKLLQSSDVEISQYLTYWVQTETGIEERTTTNIDTYLEHGGEMGEAVVTVSYRGSETTYKINILENPYERMVIIPQRTIYYTDCASWLGDNIIHSGDQIDPYFNITLYKKDGTSKSYDSWYSLPNYWERGNYGLKIENKDGYYLDIDHFISAGGAVGEQELEVSYCGMEVSHPVTIKENPYDHIRIAQEPSKLKYLHNKYQSLELSGMVIYAYKDAEESESNYDVYRYDDYQNYHNNPGSMTEEQYYIMRALFDTTLGGHNSIPYLEQGNHIVSVYLMGHKAEYEIEVVEQMAAGLTILQAPSKMTYYANSRVNIDLSGLIIEVEDLQGNITKYKYAYNPSYGNIEEEDVDYGNWWDIENEYFAFSSDIDWSQAGNYTVTLECFGLEDTYEVTVLPDPVEELKITKMPEKISYYEYESRDIDLTGMEYQILYQDGTSYSGKAERWSCPFEYKEEYFQMSYRWKNPTFNGQVVPGDNAITVSAFGAEAVTDTIVVEENPVKSLTVLKDPDKMQYIDRDNQIDLYGMELLITYVDGSSENIAISEHVSQKEIENQYGGVVTANRDTVWEDGESRNGLRIFYLNEECNILLPKLDLSALDSVELKDEGCYHTELTEEKPYSVYSFTPAESKTYHFFSSGKEDSYVVLYEENREIGRNDDGGVEGTNFRLSYTLEAGKTYYYVVSHYNFGRAAVFDCYFSSTTSSFSNLEITDFKITKPVREKYYDFEPERIYAGNLSLYGTEYEINYSNGWKKTGKITENYGPSMDISGTTLSIEWKYTVLDEYGKEEYVEKREDNALIYTYGDKKIECPVQFDVPSPVESMTITDHPWKEKGVYEYQAYNLNGQGLSVKISYNDGREGETVVWENTGMWQSHEGYEMQLYWKDAELSTNEENTLLLSYMGKTTELAVKVLDTPVKEMQVLHLPDKTEYYPFEGELDLYGMELKITYKDGTEQTLQVSTHGSAVQVPGEYEEVLFSEISYEYDEDKNATAMCRISYLGYRLTFMPYQIRSFTLGNSCLLNLNEEKTEVLQDRYQIFSFIAPEMGTYRFQSAYETGYYSNSIILYDHTGTELAYTRESYLEYEMAEGNMYFLGVVSHYNDGQKITCSITMQSGQEREKIQTAELSLDSLEAGNSFVDYSKYDYKQFYVSDCKWLNDVENDGIADYGTAHRLMLTLKPYASCQFTSATSVMVNGKRIAEKSLSSDGRLTLYYTFPYTKCRIFVPDQDGYELDQSQNAELGVCNYGEDYKFRFLKKAENTSSGKLIVKAGDTVLLPNEEGYYLIEKAAGNVTVTVKTSELQAGEKESKLTFYNKSTDIFDILIGKQNAKTADNENGESSLPVLESYVNGSDQFFFGWYLDKDASVNGKGTRFTSQSMLLNPAYDLYAKWGSGYFSYILNRKQINCKLLSIDEYNKTKVQVGDGRSVVRTAKKFYSMPAQTQNMGGRENNSTLVIPATIDLKSSPELAELGIDFSVGEVAAIADNAFAGETGITNISLPTTIEHIGSGAFANCTDLQAIDIPEGVSAIGNSAFSGCENLKTVFIPSTVGVITQGTFQGCTNLNNVVLAEGVSEIGAGAFEGCSSLTTLVLPDTIETVDSTSFTENQDLTIVCSSEMKDSEAVHTVMETTGASVVVVDVKLSCDYNEKQFTYGDDAQTFLARVCVDNQESQREILWKYPDTTAYEFTVDQSTNSITVTPKRATTEDENIVITAVDKETGKSRSLSLKTNGIDLAGTNGNYEAAFSICEIENQKYTGEEIRPQVVVVNNYTNEILDAENYDVSYQNNIRVGTAFALVQGKGNYTGSLSAPFRIEGIEKEEQFITVSDDEILKNIGDAPFELQVSTTGDGTLSYESSNPEVAVVGNTPQDRGRVTIIGAGETDITVKASETERYYPAERRIHLTVTSNSQGKKNQTIQASDITKTYGNPDFMVEASSTGNGTLRYSSSNGKVILVDAKTGKAKITGAGTADIVIKASATQEYQEASKTIKVTIHKADAKLKVTKKTYKKVYGSNAFRLKVSAKSRLTYTSNNKKTAECKNGRVILKACGTAVITVSVGDTNYKNASQKITVKVVPKKPTVKKAVSEKAGQITVTWKRQKEAAGYVVQYSTDKKFTKKVRNVEIKKNKTTSITIKKLQKGKKYYVRVKAYTKNGKKKEYGAVSKVKNARVRKN